MKIIAADVGQGDAMLIIAPSGETMLIDCGPSIPGRSPLINLLASSGVHALDEIIVTHYHEDHIGGCAGLLAGRDGILGNADDTILEGTIYDRGEPKLIPTAPSYPDYKAIASGRRSTLHPGDHINLGEVSVDVLAVGGHLSNGREISLGDPPDENAQSIALLIEYAGFRMFAGGDITGGGGTPPYETPDVESSLAPLVGEIDLLKVSHHGSKTSSNQRFIDATHPKTAIISLGDHNEYFHPHESVIERLLLAGTTIYQTERGTLTLPGPIIPNGDVVVEIKSDGSYRVIAQ